MSKFVKLTTRSPKPVAMLKANFALSVRIAYPQEVQIRIAPCWLKGKPQEPTYELQLDTREAWGLFLSLANQLGAQAQLAGRMLDVQQDLPVSAATQLMQAVTDGAEVNTPDFLDWIADRLVNVYSEAPYVDFVLSCRKRAADIRAAMAAMTEAE